MGGKGGLLAGGVSVAVSNAGGGIRRESLAKGGVIVAVEDGAVGGSQQADAAEGVVGVIRGLSGGVGD